MSDELVYFLHIPKTAGTSLHQFLIQVGGPDRVLPPNLIWDHLIRGMVEITDRTRIIGGHFAGLLPLWLRRWPRIITILRDPLARAVSHINHVQRDVAHPLHAASLGLSVEEYCAHPVLRRTVENFQARSLASLRIASILVPKGSPHELPFGTISVGFEDALYALDAADGLRDAAIQALDEIDAVGVCEAFGPSLRLYAKVLGWPGEVEEPRLNPAAAGQKTVAALTDRERDTLIGLNQIDLAVYRHACERFRQLCQRHGVELTEAARTRLAAA